MLIDAGLTPQAVEDFIGSRPDQLEKMTEIQGALFGKSALDILAKAEEQATLTNSVILEAEHVLIALLNQKKGETADLFGKFRVKRDKFAELLAVQLQ